VSRPRRTKKRSPPDVGLSEEGKKSEEKGGAVALCVHREGEEGDGLLLVGPGWRPDQVAEGTRLEKGGEGLGENGSGGTRTVGGTASLWKSGESAKRKKGRKKALQAHVAEELVFL